MEKLKKRLIDTGACQEAGAFVLVDGQYGSTGKGLAASLLAEMFAHRIDTAVSNAGPNSGHTSYYGDEKIVLTQLPTFAVTARKMGEHVMAYMDAGAIVDMEKMGKEIIEHGMTDYTFVNPNAAVVTDLGVQEEQRLSDRIGSTGKGTGAALATKIMRAKGATVGTTRMMDRPDIFKFALPPQNIRTRYDNFDFWRDTKSFVEVSQGFSLSINADGFYPYCTSRDCTVAQAMSDANMHPSYLHRTMMVVRCHPIRVGGNSGPCYPDQMEIDWKDIGVEPERTTVTNKVRRIFTWSPEQYVKALIANQPDYVFVNFLNYIREDERRPFINKYIYTPYVALFGYHPKAVLMGLGPRNDQVELYE